MRYGRLGECCDLEEGNIGRGLGVCMYVLKNGVSNVLRINLYAELDSTREGKCLMVCDVFIGRGATWQCV